MSNDRMPGLHEGFRSHFPVGRHYFADPDGRRALLVLPALEVLWKRRKKFFQARPAGILADEDVTAPARYLGLGQIHLLILQVAEVPAAGDFSAGADLDPG